MYSYFPSCVYHVFILFWVRWVTHIARWRWSDWLFLFFLLFNFLASLSLSLNALAWNYIDRCCAMWFIMLMLILILEELVTQWFDKLLKRGHKVFNKLKLIMIHVWWKVQIWFLWTYSVEFNRMGRWYESILLTVKKEYWTLTMCNQIYISKSFVYYNW